MKILHQVWKQLIWVWNGFQGYEKSAWRCEKYDKCYETNTPLKPGTKIVSMVRNGVQIEAHSTFSQPKMSQNLYCWPLLFRTIETIFVPDMDLFRTIETIFVPGWYKNSFNCTKQIHSCVSLFSWCTTWSTPVHFSQPKMSQNLYCVPLVAHHEWICFVLLKKNLYQAGTKKVSIVRNPFESSEKLGG
jgi:hypothetical protein